MLYMCVPMIVSVCAVAGARGAARGVHSTLKHYFLPRVRPQQPSANSFCSHSSYTLSARASRACANGG